MACSGQSIAVARGKGELELHPAVECGRERLGGHNGQFTRLGLHVKALNLLIANGWGMEWYKGQNEEKKCDDTKVSPNFLMVWTPRPTFVMVYI